MSRLVLLVCTEILFSVHIFSQSFDDIHSTDRRKVLLKTVLEKMRSERGLNFVYGDNIVGKIEIDSVNMQNLDEENLKKLLHRYNLAYKFYGNENVVIFNKIKKERKNNGTVVIKNFFEFDSTKIIEPKIVSEIIPVYPPEAVSGNIEGILRIKLFVTKKGDVSEIIVQKSSGSILLDSAAVNYASKLKFIPAQINGEFHSIWLYKDFKYIIDDKHNPK